MSDIIRGCPSQLTVVARLAHEKAARVAVPQRQVLPLAQVLLFQDPSFDECGRKNNIERVGALLELVRDVDTASKPNQLHRAIAEPAQRRLTGRS